MGDVGSVSRALPLLLIDVSREMVEISRSGLLVSNYFSSILAGEGLRPELRSAIDKFVKENKARLIPE